MEDIPEIDIVSILHQAIRERNGPKEAVQKFACLEGKKLIGTLADLLIKIELRTRINFPFAFDYEQGLEQMVLAGHFAYVDHEINSANFPVLRRGFARGEVILKHFDREIEKDEAIEWFANRGLVPARIEHACAIGVQYPELQREFPIAFIGSVAKCPDGRWRSPFLGSWCLKRGLELDDQDLGWDRLYRFAAIKLGT